MFLWKINISLSQHAVSARNLHTFLIEEPMKTLVDDVYLTHDKRANEHIPGVILHKV